ncbi:unnamed protein product [Heterobilharzia americana]|nr:unnamed protein product [Heterobilharzia americana]
MVGLELLTINDIVTDSPHTKLLVSAISENASKAGDYVRQLREGFQAVSQLEVQLANAYRDLSTLLRDIISQKSTFCSDEEIRQLGFQFSSFLDELGLLHGSYGNELHRNLVDKLQEYISDVFDRLPKEYNDVENCEKLREQAYQNFMKLPKKCTPKIHQNSVLEVTSARRKFACMAARYYGHLNEAEQIRDLAPLMSIRNFIAGQKNHIHTSYNLFSQDIVHSLIETAERSLQKYVVSFDDVKRKSVVNLNSVEHKSLSYFCPEPWILNITPNQDFNAQIDPREPNRKLLTKSGCLLMRTRVNLGWRWIEVYCLTQNGNLMYQQYGDIAASLLFDLNQKGVYTEATDVDDRRNVFQVVSPTERKTILFQAESETERDENDITYPGVGGLMDYVNPVEHDLTYIDWFSNYLPQIHFDLNPVTELTSLLDTELHILSEEDNNNNDEKVTSIENDINQITVTLTDENNQNIEENNTSQTNSDHLIPHKPININMLSNNMFPCQFLGAVDLPMDHFPPNQLNDIFTYVLSCRSAFDSPLPIPCNITITTSDLWVLTNQQMNNYDNEFKDKKVDNEKWNVSIRIPFRSIRSWNNHPDNHKLGCLVVQGPLNDVETFSNNNGCVGFTFESEVTQSITERLLAAEFNRLDKLEHNEKNQLERCLLTSSIAQISNNTFPEIRGSLNADVENAFSTNPEIVDRPGP